VDFYTNRLIIVRRSATGQMTAVASCNDEAAARIEIEAQNAANPLQPGEAFLALAAPLVATPSVEG
jgi:hypothetical protein